PWGECHHGKAITANALARMLKPFAIRPHGTIRIGERTSQGYLRDQFEDAWSRYLPQNTDSSAPQPSHPSQCSKNAGLSSSSKPSQTTDVMDAESEETPVKRRAVMNVMDANQGVKLKGRHNGKMPAIAEGRRKAKLTPQEWLR